MVGFRTHNLRSICHRLQITDYSTVSEKGKEVISNSENQENKKQENTSKESDSAITEVDLDDLS